MKKILVALMLLLFFALVGCEQETKKTAEGWAAWYVFDECDYGFTYPYQYTVEDGHCVFDEQDDGEWACFVIAVQDDLDNDAKERKFAVVVSWEQNAFDDCFGVIYIRGSDLTDIDAVEIE